MLQGMSQVVPDSVMFQAEKGRKYRAEHMEAYA